MYEPRSYRQRVNRGDLVSYEVIEEETDLLISTQRKMASRAAKLVVKYRNAIKGYIARYPGFAAALTPLPPTPDMPDIIAAMVKAADTAGVGPMAAVAGAVAEFVGRELSAYSDEVIVENGGDIFLCGRQARRVGVFAGDSPFSRNIALEITPADLPLGVCTSSGTVGHSLSYGKADAVIVLADDTALADAAATAIANTVNEEKDIEPAIQKAQDIPGLGGIVIILGESLGIWGNVKLQSLAGVENA